MLRGEINGDQPIELAFSFAEEVGDEVGDDSDAAAPEVTYESVTDDTGRAVPDYAVVLFAEDNELWGFMSRFIKLARPDQQGGYQVKDLPPGRYLGVAVETIESGEETDPALLERMRSMATPFTLNDGEQRALNLKLVRGY